MVLVAGEETGEVLGTWRRAAAAEVVVHPAPAVAERGEGERESTRRHAG